MKKTVLVIVCIVMLLAFLIGFATISIPTDSIIFRGALGAIFMSIVLLIKSTNPE